MRPEIELLTGDPAEGGTAAAPFLAGRWAMGLALALLMGLALATAARWWESVASSSPSGGPEVVIQQAVPPDPFPASNRAETTAPDPGDSPPP